MVSLPEKKKTEDENWWPERSCENCTASAWVLSAYGPPKKGPPEPEQKLLSTAAVFEPKSCWHPMHCQSTSAYTNRTFSPLRVDTLSLSIACFRILNAEAFDANKSWASDHLWPRLLTATRWSETYQNLHLIGTHRKQLYMWTSLSLPIRSVMHQQQKHNTPSNT